MERPRYKMRSQHPVVFLGQAGAVDLWRDTEDTRVPYLVVHGSDLLEFDWCADVPSIINEVGLHGLHLTLHDQCLLYQLTDNNGVSERPNQGDDKDEHAQC